MWLFDALRRHPWRVLGFLVAGFLCVAFADAVSSAREAARRSQCKNNLKQIGLALHNYHDTYNCFPPAIIYGPDGKPWHSWRVIIMPYIECGSFYSEYSFDEPWNGPHNSELAKKFVNGAPFVYRCPTDEKSNPQNTSYVAVIDENTVWPPHGVASFQDVTDSTKNTLFVVEVGDSGVHWMEPRDLRLDAMSFRINAAHGVGIRGQHGALHYILSDVPTGANVGTVDGWVEFLNAETPPADVRSMLIRNDGKPTED